MTAQADERRDDGVAADDDDDDRPFVHLEMCDRVQDMLDILEEEVGKHWMTLRMRMAIERVKECLYW
jgi:hypothetical protein